MTLIKRFALLALLATVGAPAAVAQEPKLNIDQQNKLRIGKLDKNSKDRVAQALLADYAPVRGKADFLIPPAALKKSLADLGVIENACATILKGFDDVKMPEEHAEAKALRAWAKDTSASLEPIRKDYEARLPEAEKLADPASYPDLEKDLAVLDSVVEDFRKGLRGKIEEVADRATRFPEVVKWQSGAFQRYRAFMVLNGGPKNPLYVKFQQAGAALKALQAESTQYVANADKGVPALLKDAEEMAAKAAAEKKPAFFTGGVKQKTDQARETVALCEALLGKEAEQAAGLRKQCDAAQARIETLAGSLKEQILAEARAPKEEYAGADKEELRKRIQEEWKKAHPQDTVLEVRFPRPWERKVEWRVVGDAFQKSDLSYLYARVLVKASDKVASVFVAVVNKDHLKGDFVTFGVHTKKGIWVVDEVLLANLGK